MNDDEKDMLPCPFCGADAHMTKGDGYEHAENGVCCNSCDAYISGDGDTKEAATAAWNRRTAQPQYREPTLEDAGELCNVSFAYSHSSANMDEAMLAKLKQLGFVRKVTPNE